MLEIRKGFTDIWSTGHGATVVLVGILSQGTGIFGGLILLDRRENSFCVPVNRASSVLAGLCASLALALFLGHRMPGSAELLGAGLVVAAIVALSLPTVLGRRSVAGR
jgi:hypothetical protein